MSLLETTTLLHLATVQQILFWRGNRIYKLIENDNKIYGVYLAGQFHSKETIMYGTGLIVFIPIFVFISFLAFILLSLILPNDILNYVRTGNLNWYFSFEILASFGFWILFYQLAFRTGLISKNSWSPFADWINKIFKISQKSDERQLKAIKLIESKDDLSFLDQSKNNFIIPISSINEVIVLDKKLLMSFPESSVGKVKFVLNNHEQNYSFNNKFLSLKSGKKDLIEGLKKLGVSIRF